MSSEYGSGTLFFHARNFLILKLDKIKTNSLKVRRDGNEEEHLNHTKGTDNCNPNVRLKETPDLTSIFTVVQSKLISDFYLILKGIRTQDC